MRGAYYLNGLKAWREQLLKDQRLGVARLERLRAQKHPDTNDHADYLDLRTRVIGLIEAELNQE